MNAGYMEKIKMCAESEVILNGKTALGIEFGSTRIKAVLIDEQHKVLAIGSHVWETKLENGIWTYSLEDVWRGLQDSYKNLKEVVKRKYQINLTRLGVIGLSGMQHGYMPFDKDDNLLVPMRTWRNTITGPASVKLTELFNYPIPQRWSIAHLYQAILNQEAHLPQITYMTTVAGYVHWKLTGKKVVGINEASGIFPIDLETKTYNQRMINQFHELIGENTVPWSLNEIFPEVLVAGQSAGVLTEVGAKLLDPSGETKAGIPMCPPEGDTGTGLVATNGIAVHSANISAGTSIYAAVVLEKELKKAYTEIDLGLTPDGNLFGMVHCNNCTSDLNGWIKLFDEVVGSVGFEVDKSEFYRVLYNKALEGDKDCGGLLSYNYLSGEHITGFEKGRPLFVRSQKCKFNLANFMRTHLYTCLGGIRLGMDLLLKEEDVIIDKIIAQGGLFKTEKVGQSIVAAALNLPVSVMETAGEGGAWGMAVLAAYMKKQEEGESFASYLTEKVFKDVQGVQVNPNPEDAAGFNRFMERYVKGLNIEKAAVECF